MVAKNWAIREKSVGLPDSTCCRDRFHEHAVGKCTVVVLKIWGGLLVTGIQVSTIHESFFRELLLGEVEDMLSTAGWLQITAANGLDIPFLGYLELDVETMGTTLPGCGFLVVKEHQQMQTTVHAEFETTQS